MPEFCITKHFVWCKYSDFKKLDLKQCTSNKCNLRYSQQQYRITHRVLWVHVLRFVGYIRFYFKSKGLNAFSYDCLLWDFMVFTSHIGFILWDFPFQTKRCWNESIEKKSSSATFSKAAETDEHYINFNLFICCIVSGVSWVTISRDSKYIKVICYIIKLFMNSFLSGDFLCDIKLNNLPFSS